jgi:diguanylate cyclase (GGDEF)-like protein/PAS domain S-box-containing protein
MSYRAILGLASVLLMAIFAGVGLLGSRLVDDRLQASLESEALRLKTAYELSQGELEQQMMALAGMLASDPETTRLLKAAAEAVKLEGGGSGRDYTQQLRQRLYAHLQQHWAYLQKELGVRQMQFLLPGTLSFLRFHAPAEHGDGLADLRWLLRDVERSRMSSSGFETGRAYAGIRGAVPIFDGAVVPGQSRPLLGVMEVGVAFDGYIKRLSERTSVGFGVLLEPEAVTSAMWEGYRPPASSEQPGACCYLLAASRGELADWMAQKTLPAYAGVFRNDLIEHRGETFQLIRFPLRDYPGVSDPSRSPIGSVLIWQDVGGMIVANREFKQKAVFNLTFAYLVTQLLVLFLVNLSRREWHSQLLEQTVRVKQLLHQNEVLLMTAGEGIFGVDGTHAATFINPAAQKMLGYAPEEVIGKNLHALIHALRPDGSSYEEKDCPIARTLADAQPRAMEENLRRRDGSCFPVQMTISPIREDGRCTGAVVVFHDISELKEKEAALTRLASTDTLTGLANRRHFIEKVAAEIHRWSRTGHASALLMVDLDWFKQVNDNWGHAAGDEVLRHFADVLRRSLRRVDLPGRVGGEEFAILLPGSSAEDALAAAERLRRNVENEPALTSFGAIAFTVSIGVTRFVAGDDSPDQPLLRADRALYRAKAAGRNRVAADFPDSLTPVAEPTSVA